MSLYLKEPSYPDFSETLGKLTRKIADLRLPYDASKWDDEVVDALHEQHPYLPQGQVKLSMNVRDTKNGYGVGNITIDDKVQLPVIIDNFHLKPFDLFMKGGELHALTKETILGALQHTEFGTTVAPGGGESSDVFMTHTRPPFDGKYTFASVREKRAFFGMFNKRQEQAEAGGHDPFNVDAKQLASTDHGMDDQLVQKLLGTPGGRVYLQMMMSGQVSPPKEEKLASWTEGDPKKVEEALSNVFDPDGSEYFLSGDKRMHKILDAAMSGTKKYQHMKHQGSVHEPGMTPLVRNTPDTTKKVAKLVRPPAGELTSEGGNVVTLSVSGAKVAGFMFDKVYDCDFGMKDAPRFVPSSGAGYQDGPLFVVSRVKTAAEIGEFPEAAPNSGETGMWIWPQNGQLFCTELLTVLDKTASVFRVKNAARNEHTLAQHPLMGVVVKEKGVTYLPKQATFVTCTNKELVFGPTVHEPDSFIALNERGGRYKVAFYVSREARQKLGRTLYEDMSEPKASNLLGRFFDDDSIRTAMQAAKRSGSGVKIAFDNVDLSSTVDPQQWGKAVTQAVSTIKKHASNILAAALKLRVVDGAPLRKLAEDCASCDPKAAWWLKAAVEYDEDDDAMNVDKALSLNIVTPQNVQKYVDGIDLLDRARQFTLKLLLASRLGLTIDTDAARTAAFALDEVVRDLQQLRSLSTAGVEG